MGCLDRKVVLLVGGPLLGNTEHAFKFLSQSKKLPTIGRSCSFAKQTSRLGFQSLTNDISISKILRRRYSYSGSDPRAALDETFALQLLNSFRDGQETHREFGSQFAPRQGSPERVFSFENFVPNQFICFAAKTARRELIHAILPLDTLRYLDPLRNTVRANRSFSIGCERARRRFGLQIPHHHRCHIVVLRSARGKRVRLRDQTLNHC